MGVKFPQLGFVTMAYLLSVGVSLELSFYSDVCPEAEAIIFSWVKKVVMEDPRMAASLLRLHFHDCFVNGCDASVLLDDTEGFIGEKTALPNLNSLRGFEVIDAIKTEIEAFCPQTVSCADILAIAARDSVVVSGGPSWEVAMGRKDGFSASRTEANNNIPSPNSTVSSLFSKFQSVGLDIKDLVALSGAHTIGKARCSSFSARLAPQDFTPPDFTKSLRELCISDITYDGDTAGPLDTVTPLTFDNQYFINLLSGEGLLPSDQTLSSGDSQTARDIVITYAEDTYVFFSDFANSMVKMGNIASTSSASPGEIRRQCRSVNQY